MRRGYGSMGNRLAPQRDDMATRRDLEEEKKRAREQAMMRRISSKPGGGY
jgi:hypothetical protein